MSGRAIDGQALLGQGQRRYPQHTGSGAIFASGLAQFSDSDILPLTTSGNDFQAQSGFAQFKSVDPTAPQQPYSNMLGSRPMDIGHPPFNHSPSHVLGGNSATSGMPNLGASSPSHSSYHGGMNMNSLGIQGGVPLLSYTNAAVELGSSHPAESAILLNHNLYDQEVLRLSSIDTNEQPASIIQTALTSPDHALTQPQLFGPVYTSVTPAISNASFHSPQSTPLIGHNTTPYLLQGMRVENVNFDFANPPELYDLDSLLPVAGQSNEEFGYSTGDRPLSELPPPHGASISLLGINQENGYSPIITPATEVMARTISQSRSATSDNSYGLDGISPISSISSAAVPPYNNAGLSHTSSPSNGLYPREPTVRLKVRGVPGECLGEFSARSANPGLKRQPSDTLEAPQNSRPSKKRNPRACLACYLAHKKCGTRCPKCNVGDGDPFPVCVSSDITEKNIFYDCLNDGEKSLATKIMGHPEHKQTPSVKILAKITGRQVDLKLMMEFLSEYKVQDPNAHAPFFQGDALRTHTIVTPFYQVSVALQARSLFKRQQKISYNESDLLVLRAVSASRMLSFIHKTNEKNTKPKNMKKGGQRARNFIVFLAIAFEQARSFHEQLDCDLNPSLADKRDDLVYHLAYLLRHMSKATFSNGNLFSEIHIGPNNEVFLQNSFWTHLNRLFSDPGGEGALEAGSPTPKVIVSPPTFRSTSGAQVRMGSTTLAHKPWKRRSSEDHNDDQDNADARSLLEVRSRTDEGTVDQLIFDMEATHIFGPNQATEFCVGHFEQNQWNTGLPAEAPGSSSSTISHGDRGVHGFSRRDAAGETSSTQGTIIGLAGSIEGGSMDTFDNGVADYGAEFDFQDSFGFPGYDNSSTVRGSLGGAANGGFLVDVGAASPSGDPGVSGVSGVSGALVAPGNVRGYGGNADRPALGGVAVLAGAAGVATTNPPGGGIRRRLTNGKRRVTNMFRRQPRS